MPAYKKWTMEAPADVVAKAIRDGAAGRSLSIYGWSMKLFFLLCKIVPHPVIIAAAARLDT